MSRKLSSPAAQLLRGSRLFSLPPPIPGAGTAPGTSSDYTSASETATQPFPTRQAIATPPSSLGRGDWGLKRPLPLRETTRSSAPTMRVYEIDTINLFTDFESAGDHVRTLEKWQEMNIPLTLSPEARMTASGKQAIGASVFHERFDNTQLTPEARQKGHSKWKFKGPYMAGMTEGQFKAYLESQIRRNKDAFKEHLRKYFDERAFTDALAKARDAGVPQESLPREETFQFSEEDFEHVVKVLRENTTLSSEMSGLIRDFFDLPGVHADPLPADALQGTAGELLLEHMRNKAAKGPPSTHPSAGLSYLRSSAFLNNHPILGPQASREPIEARLLVGRQTNQRASQPKAGVGGVVADVKLFQSGSKANDLYFSMRYEDEGGPKVWVSPERAYIDSSGRIKLSVNPAVPEDVRIKQGSLKSKEELEAKVAPKIEELDMRAASFDTDGGSGQEHSQRIVQMLERMTGTTPRKGVDQ
ncbi:uncharacterized protein LTHEOB_4426 [Lasiodiplodia theobromae]|uniref:37S ribosomal protein MRP51 n=1 Tax=Lasiodiplodia theobromae TaxID=45133 RepID=A0A5N5DNH9_9PEZI|nr:uncharacterized protein LTHEOB_4426 [Lasiodiplodia theobromae]KAB2578891.1 37S ribosomal protein MRP51 [Lasiodiplodia theobromae]KAF4546429.1 hypothetical protein LTHEOB_4426 [Lasiodiplodia theobromae]